MERRAEFESEELPPGPPNSPVRTTRHDTLYFNFTVHLHATERRNNFSVQHSKMVQLTEVVDEHFQEGQAGPEEDEDFTDTGTSHELQVTQASTSLSLPHTSLLCFR